MKQSNTTCSNEQSIPLTIDMLKNTIELINKYEDPIKKFIRDKGFDPDNGDLLLMPDIPQYAKYRSITHENVRYSPYLECPILMKKPPSILDSLPIITLQEDELSIGDKDHEENGK